MTDTVNGESSHLPERKSVVIGSTWNQFVLTSDGIVNLPGPDGSDANVFTCTYCRASIYWNQLKLPLFMMLIGRDYKNDTAHLYTGPLSFYALESVLCALASYFAHWWAFAIRITEQLYNQQ